MKEKKRILIIDDDPLVLKSLNLLVRSNYDVKCVKSGEEAAEVLLKDDIFDLIISDVRMPRQDGVAVIKNLKKISQARFGCEIPFVFITGYASEEAPIEAVNLNADAYILKPFDNDQLLEEISKSLSKKGRVFSKNTMQQSLLQMKILISGYQNRNEKEVIVNNDLRYFFSELEKHIRKIENEFIKFEYKA